MPALVLLAALAATPFSQDYVMSLAGVPVGRVRLALEPRDGGATLHYESETLVRRGPVVTRNDAASRLQLSAAGAVAALAATRREGAVVVRAVSARIDGDRLRLATTEGTRQLELLHEGPLLPSTLALARLGATPSCLAVVDEVDGTVGQVCGTREERRASGTLFGEPFEAELDGVRPVRLLLPRQQAAFAAVEGRPAIGSPPALFGQPVATSGAKPPPGAPATLELDFEGAPPRLPSTGSQHVERGGERVRVRWSPAGPGTREPLRRVSRGTDVLGRAAERGLAGATDRWQAAVALARFVAEQLPDKRPAEWERSPARVLEEGRASCVGHSALFVALANRVGLPARRVAGVVAQDGRFYAHAWAQVEVGGRWWDVEPTEGEAPASSPRVLLAPDADGPAAGRLLGLTRGLSIRFVDGAAQEAKP